MSPPDDQHPPQGDTPPPPPPPAPAPPPPPPPPAGAAGPPPAPTVPAEVGPNLTSGKTTLLTWNEVPGADSYEITILPLQNVRTTTTEELDITFLDSGRAYHFEIRARNASGLSEAATLGPIEKQPPRPSRSWLAISIALVIACAILGFVYLLLGQHATGQDQDFHRYRAVASFVVAAILLLVTGLGGRLGLFRPVLGFDGRISTSKTQVAIWTVFVAWALCFLVLRTVLEHAEFNPFEGFPIDGAGGDGGPVAIWDQYLILLGGPFASLVAAKGIVTAKVQDQTLQKGVEDDGSARLRQAISNDSEGTDLVDFQFLVFNVVALFYVVMAFARDNQLPEIPALLLALTGTAAGTYVLNKAVQQNAPALRDVTPSVAVPGQRIQIEGQNLLPRGDDHPPSVKIGGLAATVYADTSTNTRVDVRVPATLAPGSYAVEITTTTRATTESKSLKVVEDRAVVLGFDPPQGVPKGGGVLTVSGFGFVGALRPDLTSTSVEVDGTITPAKLASRSSDVHTIQITLPSTTSDETDLIVVPPFGGASEPVKVRRPD